MMHCKYENNRLFLIGLDYTLFWNIVETLLKLCEDTKIFGDQEKIEMMIQLSETIIHITNE